MKQILIHEKSMIALTFYLFNRISYNPTQFSKITGLFKLILKSVIQVNVFKANYYFYG